MDVFDIVVVVEDDVEDAYTVSRSVCCMAYHRGSGVIDVEVAFDLCHVV